MGGKTIRRSKQRPVPLAIVLSIIALVVFVAWNEAGIQLQSASAGPDGSETEGLWLLGWGGNQRGQLGNGNTADQENPVRVLGVDGIGDLSGLSQVDGWTDHALALSEDGSAYAWGRNHKGQLGDGTTADRHHPDHVRSPSGANVLNNVVDISTGGWRSFAVLEDGSVWGWGSNSNKRLGDGTSIDRSLPVQIVGQGGSGHLEQVQMVSSARFHTLALKSDGTVWSWGSNGHGQLGDGTATARTSPVQVKGEGGSGFLENIIAISTGKHFSLGLDSDGTIWSWGENNDGQLGDGTTTQRTTPIKVAGPNGSGVLEDNVKVMGSIRGHFAAAIQEDGTLWTWGDNAKGQLGDGTTSRRTTPVQVLDPGGSSSLQEVRDVAGSVNHMLALQQEGTLLSWGDNPYGQLGDESTSQRSVPGFVLNEDGAPLSASLPIGAGTRSSFAMEKAPLFIERGPDILDVQISWPSAHVPDGETLLRYDLYRAVVPDNLGLHRELGDATAITDDAPWCNAVLEYGVVPVYSSGNQGQMIGPSTSHPDPELQLLCLLNDHLDFYWGPVPLNNTAGDPTVPPTSFQTIDDREAATGEFPVWYDIPPKGFFCCGVLRLDGNLLRPEEGWEFNPGTALGNIVGGDVAEDLIAELDKVIRVEGKFGGWRYIDRPFIDTSQDAAAVTGDLSLSGDIMLGGGSLVPISGEAKGTAHLDSANHVLTSAKMNTLLAKTDPSGIGPSIDYESPEVGWSGKTPRLLFLIPPIPWALNGQISAGITTEISAALGGSVDFHTMTPRYLLLGIGTEVGAQGNLEGKLKFGIDLLSVEAGAHASTGIQVEVIVPSESGLGGESVRSSYTEINYKNLRGPVVALVADDTEFEIEPIHVGVGKLEGDVPIEVDLKWDKAAVVFGKIGATSSEFEVIHVGGGFDSAEGASGGPGGLDLTELMGGTEPHSEDNLLIVEGDPSAVGPVTIDRPVGYYLPNGSFEVDMWNITLPEVEIGPEGSSMLHVDGFDSQRKVLDMTRNENVSFDKAVDRVNQGVDSNGDGEADLGLGQTPYNPREPVSVIASVSGPAGERQELFMGETAKVVAQVSRIQNGGGPVESGDVAVRMEGTEIGRGLVDSDGVAVVEAPVLSDSGEGHFDLQVEYLGNETFRRSSSTFRVSVEDRAPPVKMESPDPMFVFNESTGFDLKVRFSSPDVWDLDEESARVRFDESAWFEAEKVEPRVFEATIDLETNSKPVLDGFHEVTAQLSDERGNVGINTVPLVVDATMPRIQVVPSSHVVFDDELDISWTAGEPVVARLLIYWQDDPRFIWYEETWNDYTREGKFEGISLPPNIYGYEVEFYDTADNPPQANGSSGNEGTIVVLNSPLP